MTTAEILKNANAAKAALAALSAEEKSFIRVSSMV